MRIKRYVATVLLFLMVTVLVSCNDMNPNPNDIYLPKTVLHTYRNMSGFHEEYKYQYQYDSYGNVVKKEDFTKGFSYARDRCVDTTFTYDEHGNVLKEWTHHEEFSTKLTDGTSKYTLGFDCYYNETGQLVKKEIIQDPSSLICLIRGYKYEYDEQGNCIKELQYYPDGTEETNVEYQYDTSNRLIREKHFSNVRTFNLSYLQQDTEYVYEDGKKARSRTIRYESTGQSYSEERTTYYYDEWNRLIREESVEYTPDGEKSIEQTREYKDFIKVEEQTYHHPFCPLQ